MIEQPGQGHAVDGARSGARAAEGGGPAPVPFYLDDWLTIYGGDARDVLRELPDESVDCVVTSPPYWNLRDYGTASWIGGDPDCDHKGKPIPSHAGFNERYFGRTTATDAKQDDARRELYRDACGKCGAQRVDRQIGLERTPDEYVETIVGVFREVRRVLKRSGTLWLNLGDSYIDRANASQGALHRRRRDKQMPPRLHSRPDGLKDKDLAGVPFRVVLALQADGWWWRSTVIWHKPNPMPESVDDRPTTGHEYLFLLTKAARYYYDADAVREKFSPNTIDMKPSAAKVEEWRATADEAGMKANRLGLHDGRSAFEKRNPAGRNLRSVWTIATRPYPGAHFAVFPPELPERCIKAGSSERGVCPECGAPWRRILQPSERYAAVLGEGYHDGVHPEQLLERGMMANHGRNRQNKIFAAGVTGAEYVTTGWEPTCGHTDQEPVPAVVLDPFGGSGTVGLVAQALRRRAVLIDLNPAYLEQQLERASRQFGVGGRRLVDKPSEPPPDSLWAHVGGLPAEEAS